VKLSQNIAEVFLAEKGELTVREVLERSEHRGFGFLLVILSLPVALPFTPPGVSMPFAVLIAGLAVQMMLRRDQPWFPTWVMDRRMKTGDNRFMRAMVRWAVFFERFLRPRAEWLYAPAVFRWFMGPVLLLASVAMALPFPGTNSASSFAIFLMALGLLEDDGVFGLAGIALALAGIGIATTIVVLLVLYGPGGIEIAKGWFGR